MQSEDEVSAGERFLLVWKRIPQNVHPQLREQTVAFRDAMTERHGRSESGDRVVEALIGYVPSETSRILRVLKGEADLTSGRTWDAVFEFRPDGRWMHARSRLLFAVRESWTEIRTMSGQTHFVGIDFPDGVPSLIDELPPDGPSDAGLPRVGIGDLFDRDDVEAELRRIARYQSFDPS